MPARGAVLIASLLLPLLLPVRAAHGLVISEIHYNPPVGEEALEFIEVTNDAHSPEDLSGWAFIEGIHFVFPPGTVLGSRRVLVIAADAAAVAERYDLLNVIGNYEGRLDASGERVRLVNHVGIEMQNVRYRDRGKWSSLADGTGHSLILRSLHLDSSEPESWKRSAELGGNPGLLNLPDERPAFDDFALLNFETEWLFQAGAGPYSDPGLAWTATDFDDSSWEAGRPGFGFGNVPENSTLFPEMRGNHTSVALRLHITAPQDEVADRSTLLLGMRYDDGFCAFVNGVELARGNCPEEVTWDATATRSHDASVQPEEVYDVPKKLLVPGDNVIAMIGYNRRISSNNFALLPRILRRVFRVEVPVEEIDVHFNELVRTTSETPGWVEIHNSEPVAVDLSGWSVTDDPDRPDPFVLPDPTVVPPGGFLVLSEETVPLDLSGEVVQLSLRNPRGIAMAAYTFDRPPPPEVLAAGAAEARFPDGSPELWITPLPTPGTANQVSRQTAIVINEIFYHPPEGRDGEFIELYHRGTEPVDLTGYRFTKGIEYEFPAGSSLQPGEFVVLGRDVDLLRERYALPAVLGPYSGQLSNQGENLRLLDAMGNVADEVRYHDGGQWSLWADGRGSSLELIAPRQDNDYGSAWVHSDETAKAEWNEHTFFVEEYAEPLAEESELNVFFVERGVALIDDVSLRPLGGSDAEELLPDGGFENDPVGWRLLGTHSSSERMTDGARSGSGALLLTATGKGDSTCNRIETDTTAPLEGGRGYEVSLWTKWQGGSSTLVAHADFSAGPWPGQRDTNLSGNVLAQRLRMSVPTALGTPGAQNTATLRLAENGGNLGPVIGAVRHAPPSPGHEVPVRVEARVLDADGVASVVARYRVVGAEVPGFASAELFEGGGGVFAGAIPPASSLTDIDPRNATPIEFYIEATDTAGEVRRFPPEAPTRALVYQASLPIEEGIDVFSAQEIGADLFSNELVDGTVVIDNDQVYYNVGLRYRGSPWGRPSRQSLRLRFPNDDAYNGTRRAVNLGNRDRGGDGPGYYIIGRAGTPEEPVPVADYKYTPARVNGRDFGVPGLFEPFDRRWIARWYGDAAANDGILLKAIGRLWFNNDCGMRTWDEVALHYRGESPENYRFYWFHGLSQTRDNWEPLIRASEILDIHQTPDAVFDEKVAEHLNLDAFLRVMSARIALNEGDALFYGNGHNGYLFWEPTEERWHLLPFDMGSAGWGGLPASLTTVRDVHIQRLLNRPWIQRRYFRIIQELADGYWNREAAGPFLTALREDVGLPQPLNYIIRFPNNLDTLIGDVTNNELRFVTNNGNDFTTDGELIILEGEAPIRLETLMWRQNEGAPETLAPEWITASRWRASFPLPADENRIEVFGADGEGQLEEGAAITIRRSEAVAFLRGDVDRSGSINVADGVATLDFLFRRALVTCPDAADYNDDGSLDLTDVVTSLDYVFRDGVPPPSPFPERGFDTTSDSLSCSE